MDPIVNLERLLAKGQDNAMLRFGLANAYVQQGNLAQAVVHARKALDLDPSYSAAWKLYGRALADLRNFDEAVAAYTAGIEAADKKGDVQAAKEMRVFLKRLQKEAEL